MNHILFLLAIAFFITATLTAYELSEIKENYFGLSESDLEFEFGQALHFWLGVMVGIFGFALISLI